VRLETHLEQVLLLQPHGIPLSISRQAAVLRIDSLSCLIGVCYIHKVVEVDHAVRCVCGTSCAVCMVVWLLDGVERHCLGVRQITAAGVTP